LSKGGPGEAPGVQSASIATPISTGTDDRSTLGDLVSSDRPIVTGPGRADDQTRGGMREALARECATFVSGSPDGGTLGR
jgi:hypothetical protein